MYLSLRRRVVLEGGKLWLSVTRVRGSYSVRFVKEEEDGARRPYGYR